MTDRVTHRVNQIRSMLRAHPDGLTRRQIQDLVPGWTDKTIQSDLDSMPDAYIDRWQSSSSKYKYVAVWCIVTPPPNCPKPD